jgi:hypothetical protein
LQCKIIHGYHQFDSLLESSNISMILTNNILNKAYEEYMSYKL